MQRTWKVAWFLLMSQELWIDTSALWLRLVSFSHTVIFNLTLLIQIDQIDLTKAAHLRYRPLWKWLNVSYSFFPSFVHFLFKYNEHTVLY